MCLICCHTSQSTAMVMSGQCKNSQKLIYVVIYMLIYVVGLSAVRFAQRHKQPIYFSCSKWAVISFFFFTTSKDITLVYKNHYHFRHFFFIALYCVHTFKIHEQNSLNIYPQSIIKKIEC